MTLVVGFFQLHRIFYNINFMFSKKELMGQKNIVIVQNCPHITTLFFVFLSFWHHSDQMSEGTQVSKVTLCVQILNSHGLTHSLTKDRYWAARAAKKPTLHLKSVPVPCSYMSLCFIPHLMGPWVHVWERPQSAKYTKPEVKAGVEVWARRPHFTNLQPLK